jgi:hypothetical protein
MNSYVQRAGTKVDGMTVEKAEDRTIGKYLRTDADQPLVDCQNARETLSLRKIGAKSDCGFS